MKNKMICCLMVLSLASVSMADTYRFSGGTWTNPASWGGTVPTGADVARINVGGASGTLSSATSVGAIEVGVDESGGLTLNSGASLTVGTTSWSGMGAGGGFVAGSFGNLTINSGAGMTVGGDWLMGVDGNGVGGVINLMLNGGTMNVAGTFIQQNVNVSPFVRVDGAGAILTVNALSLSRGTITLANGGRLVVASNVTNSTWRADGFLVGDGGNAVTAVWDGSTTTFQSIPEPAAIGVIGVCGLFALLIRKRLRS